MTANKFKKSLIIFSLGCLLFTQIFYFQESSVPKAEASINPCDGGICVPIAKYDELPKPITKEGIWMAIAEGALMSVTERFTKQFVDRLIAKYRIGNYLYYDQVLSNYYLTNYISDKVSDPDLRNIYSLLQAGYVTGDNTGTTGGPDPNKALVPKIKQAIYKKYLKDGGYPTDKITNPPPEMTDWEFLSGLELYSLNPPDATEQQVRTDFTKLQSNASTASQLEVIVGNGLKAGRVIGGQCMMPTGPEPDLGTQEACEAANGTWQVSALDQARSFISNPTTEIEKWLQATIQSFTNVQYDPNNFWVKIGNSLGSFLYNKLSLNKSSGVLPDGTNYTPGDYSDKQQEIDIDGDNVMDGVDTDGDGKIDKCYFGGTPPDQCTGSSTLTKPPGGADCTTNPVGQACTSADQSGIVVRVKNYLVSQGIDLSGDCGAFEITKRVAWALKDQGIGLISKGGTNCNGFSTDKIAFSDKSGVDILGCSGGGPDCNPPEGNVPAWLPFPVNPSIVWAAPSDPGDPPGSY